ncbi:hypothetical protein C2845_PM15G02730 [Panicum miliaceum]|uniref:Uncharacterized protein n=1 Tax=Panicum miliaceum TaxID=4540 RepID=A0A3L6Q8S2_PANMI|nr:hypothetical protein C2845_PM15G02730 [Panicum miliaceum]
MVAPSDEPTDNVPVVDTQRYPMDDITMQTACYSVVTVEQILDAGGENENLELDFIGGDGEWTLGEALHIAFYGAKSSSNLLGIHVQRLPKILLLL